MAQTGRVDVGGSVERRFEPVREVVAELLSGQRGTGSAVAAWWDGAWVVDLWGGLAAAAGTRRWQSDSLVQPYSVAKPFAAVCALLLVDRGQLELDAPVRRYWPQSRAPADVRQLLSHQAGVVALDEPAPPRRSITGTGCARCWQRRSRPPGSRGPRMASRRCSTGISSASWFGVSMAAGWGSHSRATEVENVFRGCLGVPPLDE